MLPQQLVNLLNAAFDSPITLDREDPEQTLDDVGTDETFDEYMEKLRFFFDDNILLAALDLVDRNSVIKFIVPWGHAQYHVLGTSATYTVYPGKSTGAHAFPPYCTCLSFAFCALVSDAQFMCKHVIATMLAERMSRCIERRIAVNDLATIAVQQACAKH